AGVVQRLRKEFPDVHFILIDVGYRSPEVQRILRPLIDFYVRYDPERFKSEINGIIEAIRNPVTRLKFKSTGERAITAESVQALGDLTDSRVEQQAILEKMFAEIIRSSSSGARATWLRTFSIVAAAGVALATITGAAYYVVEQRQQAAVTRSLDYIDRGGSSD